MTLAHRFTDAFATRDVERLVDVFTPDVAYHDLFYGPHHGHDGIRSLFGRMFAEGVDHAWTVTDVLESPKVTFAQWDFRFTVSGAVPSGAGRTLRFAGVSVFAARDGRCHTYREHFDRTGALLAVGIAPEVVARIAARRPTVETIGGPP